jgi:hypothetical protein
MSAPTPTASAATVSAAADRLASSRARWALALDAAHEQRAAQPTGLLALFNTWRAQPLVSLATGLWAAWTRRRQAQALQRPVLVQPAAGLAPTRWSRSGPAAWGLVRRHPAVALTGLALVLGWAGWRRFVIPRPLRPS